MTREPRTLLLLAVLAIHVAVGGVFLSDAESAAFLPIFVPILLLPLLALRLRHRPRAYRRATAVVAVAHVLAGVLLVIAGGVLLAPSGLVLVVAALVPARRT